MSSTNYEITQHRKKNLGKVVAIIEARMTSSRLPGKVLLPVLGKPILSYLVERLKSVASIDQIVLATTMNKSDDKLAEFADSIGIQVYRGDEEDVLSRVIDAAESVGADTVVEITGDCPIIDPDLIEQALRSHSFNNVDYTSNVCVRSYPDGMDVQVFSLVTLKKSAQMTTESLDREHVTLHIRNNPRIFSRFHLIAGPLMHEPHLGLTLDEKPDYILLKEIIENLYHKNPLFGCREVLEFLDQRPELRKINRHVTRKGDS